MSDKVVYTHKLNGNVVYVGSGTRWRPNDRSDRAKEHLTVWANLRIEIVKDNLSVAESIELEQELIDKYWSTGKLFNKRKTVYSVKQISFEELDKVFYYDVTSPTFLSWKVSIAKNIKAGTPAGWLSGRGYTQVRFKGKSYQAHRVVLVLNTKEDIPEGFVVDHIDGNKSNNSIENLRVVSPSDNCRNKIHNKSNTGYQGIREDVTYSRFAVQFVKFKQTAIYFSYHNKPKKSNKKNYTTRELAFEAALAYRNSLVEQGLIVLTNKEEPDGIN